MGCSASDLHAAIAHSGGVRWMWLRKKDEPRFRGAVLRDESRLPSDTMGWTERQPDGSWRWWARCVMGSGVEPSHGYAMQAVMEALKRSRDGNDGQTGPDSRSRPG